MIQKHPPRHQSLENIARHEKKLQELEGTRETLKLRLERRKKQFHLLVQCVHQLQDMLQNEDNRGEEEGGGAAEESMEVDA